MNLLAEDLKAEVLLTIDAQGEAKIYYSKVGSMNELGMIAATLVDSGMRLASEHGITLTVGGPSGQRIEFPPQPGPVAPRPVEP